jgi:iron complex outermembrane receptor protein
MYERGDTDLFEAMRWIPGIVENGGHPGTDLGGLSLRGIGGGGHGTDYMTIMQDGVPLSDLGGYGAEGRINYSSILTGGLESIDVAKGYSSVLLGPNIMAGVLMVRTAKPQRRLELNARTGFDFDAGGFGATTNTLTAGTRLGMIYARAGIQDKYVDHWRLPDSFEQKDTRSPEDGGDPQKEGDRIWTKSNTFGANLMFGVTPLDQLDVWATYAYSSRRLLPDGWAPTRVGRTTGTPPEAHLLMQAFKYRDRHDAALHAEWTSEKFNIGLHSYFNMYDEEYHRLTPVAWGKASEVWPEYLADDYKIQDLITYSLGINLDGAYEINNWSKIAASAQFRQNDYKKWWGNDIREKPEHTDKYLTKSLTDNIWFIGAEYTVNPFKPFTGIVGLGLDMIDPQKMELKANDPDGAGIDSSDIASFTATPQWTIGLFYDITEQHELHLTYAKKNRFPSFYEREGSVGTDDPTDDNTRDIKPNNDLKPQQVHHFEFGYKGYFLERVRITTALYTNYELNKIASVALTNDPNDYDSQYQNIDENLYYGIEFGTEMFLNDYFTMGITFAINKYKILHSEAKLSDGSEYEFKGSAPQLTTNGYFSIAPFAGKDTGILENIRIMPRFEYIGARFPPGGEANLVSGSASAPTHTYLDDYVLLHLGIFADIGEHYYTSFSIHNILDQLYYTETYSPAAGRSFNISFGAKF